MKSVHLLLITLLISLCSCTKENHSIRFKNDYKETIYSARAGSAYIGDVGSGSTSSYEPINTGSFAISGRTSSGKTLSGSGNISGKGKHKWTITVDVLGKANIKED